MSSYHFVTFAEFSGARRDLAFRAVLVAVGDRASVEDAVAEIMLYAVPAEGERSTRFTDDADHAGPVMT